MSEESRVVTREDIIRARDFVMQANQQRHEALMTESQVRDALAAAHRAGAREAITSLRLELERMELLWRGSVMHGELAENYHPKMRDVLSWVERVAARYAEPEEEKKG